MVRGHTKAFWHSLFVESWRLAEEAATEIGACLEPAAGEMEPRGAYAVRKRWYWHASARAPKPSWTDMGKVGVDLQTLYQREDPHTPGLPLVTHVDPV